MKKNFKPNTWLYPQPVLVIASYGADGTADAVYHAVVMETAAEMALKTKLLNPSASLPVYILDEHYQRKHGPNATYGQGK